MKFKSDPGRVLTDTRTHRAIGKFDENGIFETEDLYYIQRLRLLFPVAEEEIEPEETAEFWRHCDICDLSFESRGAYLMHCKTPEHKAKKESK